MKKIDILEKLKGLSIKKEYYIIVGDSALVLQDIIEEACYIELCINNTSFDLDDSFVVSTNKYDISNTINIDGYNVLDLESIYEEKLLINDKKDKKLIKDLDLILCSKDSYRYERKLKDKGIKLIAGVDEVGRGPLVGPVVAACVILPDKFNLDGLTDSKKLSEKKRDDFYDSIIEQAISVGVGIIDEKKIDEVNIYEATKLAMKEAINNCSVKPEHILIDAMPLELDIPTTSIIKGDLKSITISAASVIAKVTRDRMLYELDEKYPMYDFKNNKGYPTKKHLEAIDKYGIIDEHRKSYGPVSDYLNRKRGD